MVNRGTAELEGCTDTRLRCPVLLIRASYESWHLPGIVEVKGKVKALSRVRLFSTPWALQSMGFSRPEHWSG